MTTMRAVVFKGVGKIVVEDRPVPKIENSGDVIVKVRFAGVCGSDLHWYRGHQKVPANFIPGHEFVGIVFAVGNDVKNLNPGDEVVVSIPSITIMFISWYVPRDAKLYVLNIRLLLPLNVVNASTVSVGRLVVAKRVYYLVSNRFYRNGFPAHTFIKAIDRMELVSMADRQNMLGFLSPIQHWSHRRLQCDQNYWFSCPISSRQAISVQPDS
jgi:hypothetical protein